MDKDLENNLENTDEQQNAETVTEKEIGVAQEQNEDIEPDMSAVESDLDAVEDFSAEDAMLQQADAVDIQNEVSAPQKSKMKIIGPVIVGVLVIVLAAACVMLAVKLFGGEKKEPGLPNTVPGVETSVTDSEEQIPVDEAAFLAPTKGNIASVNGVEIDGSLYDFYKAQNAYTFKNYGMTLSADICAYLEQMCFYNAVQNELMKQLGDSKSLSVTMEDAQTMMNEIITEYFSDKAAFETWLVQMGVTAEQYLDNCYYTSYSNKLYDKSAESIVITDDEAKALYNEDPTQYDTRKTSHILIAFEKAGEEVTEAEKLAAYNKALEVLQKVKETPKKFAEIAKENSADSSAAAGGVIDYAFTAHDTQLFASYVEGTWALSGVGSFSPEPVESTAGYHIIMIDEETKGYDNFVTKIKSDLFAERAEAAFNDTFSEFVDISEIKQLIKFQYSEDLAF